MTDTTTPHRDTAEPDAFVEGFDYPMFVVTAIDPASGQRAGCLVGFATQVSIEPFRYMVCLSRRNHTFKIAQASRHLAVHVLDHGDAAQRDLAELFGTETGDEIDKFARCAWEPGPGGLPLLTAASRRLTGRILERFPLGDHAGLLLAPTHLDITGEVTPLAFHDVKDLSPGHEAG